jgi:hypothetical protein
MTVNRIPSRRQPLAVAAISLVVLLVVAGAVLLVGRLAPPPEPTASPPASLATASADQSTPEGAVRAFLGALIAARRTDDPSLIEPYVTSRESSAYRTVAGFLEGQRESGKASITTVLDLEDVQVEESGDTARLTATLLETGYDIDLDTGEPLESPVTLDPRELTVELRRTDATWKVESFETLPQGATP